MLASIQKISKVFPIENADRIEGVEVLGWKCVVRKGTFKEGDLCIYIEIDTIIPKYLLDENYEGDEVVRLRTVKMKGQISQGLVLPLKILGDNFYNEEIFQYLPDKEDRYDVKEGQDISEILKIKKYEKAIPANLQGLIKGNFPGFIPKTDEVRIQSEPRLLTLLNGRPYYITTKLDGTSATYYKFNGEFGACSRNLELKPNDISFHDKDQNSENVYWRMARKYYLDSFIPDGIALQGEIIGEGINKNPLEIKGQELYIFNIFDIRNGIKIPPVQITYNLSGKATHIFADLLRGISLVPIEEIGESFIYTLDELLEKAKGNYPSGKRKEGIVVRSLDQVISFKVVNNDYLLRDEE